MSISRALFATLALTLMLVACGTPTNAPAGESPAGGSGGSIALPSEPATIIGQITRLDGSSMLVEENPGQPDAGRKIVFSLESTTLVGERIGDEIVPRSASDLRVGQRVAAWATGPLAESYPEQGSASAVVISLNDE